MHITKNTEGKHKVRLSIQATQAELDPIRQYAVKELGKDAKVPGFRPGTAPAQVVEKQLDAQALQNKFLDEALTALYTHAARQQDIQPVSKPEVTIKKFVPYNQLEFEVTTEVIGPVKVGDYKKIKVAKPDGQVTAKDINHVLESLRTRAADKKETSRAAKTGDEVWIDFSGVDTGGQPVQGADGKDYPLLLGSKTFIPGFEENLIGLQAGDGKEFTLVFPADYAMKALAGKKVKFTAKVKKVQAVTKPGLDDKFAAKAGPFKNLSELKADIKKQLTHEKEHQLDKEHQNEIVKRIVAKSEVDIPESLIDQQTAYNIDEIRRNLTYRGQTYQEFLKQEAESEKDYKDKVIRPRAERQVKTSLVLSEIAKREKMAVTPEELEMRIQILKSQHKDPAMQAELDKPENRQDISSRLLSEKVLAKLQQYCAKN
jgi:trigger factor